MFEAVLTVALCLKIKLFISRVSLQGTIRIFTDEVFYSII